MKANIIIKCNNKGYFKCKRCVFRFKCPLLKQLRKEILKCEICKKIETVIAEGYYACYDKRGNIHYVCQDCHRLTGNDFSAKKRYYMRKKHEKRNN